MRFDDFDTLAPLTAIAGLMVLALLPTRAPDADDAALRPYDTVLEQGAVGTRVAWRDPASGRTGTLAAEQPFVGADGAWCRLLSIAPDGEPVRRHAACRGADGAWLFADAAAQQVAGPPAEPSDGMR